MAGIISQRDSRSQGASPKARDAGPFGLDRPPSGRFLRVQKSLGSFPFSYQSMSHLATQKFLPGTPRMTMEITTSKKEGSQTHKSSLLITIKPHLLKKGPTLIGETIIGLHGEKYLVLSKGANKAIPKPPFVKASRIP